MKFGGNACKGMFYMGAEAMLGSWDETDRSASRRSAAILCASLLIVVYKFLANAF